MGDRMCIPPWPGAWTLWGLLAAGIWSVMVSRALAERQPIALVQGQSTTVVTEYDIGDAAITNPAVCDFLIRDSQREIYLNSRGPGVVMLTLWDVAGTQRDVIPIEVTDVDLEAVMTTARRQLGDMPQVAFVRRGDRIVMEGEVGSETLLSEVERVAAEHPHLDNRVRIGHEALRDLAAEIERAVGRPGITVRHVKDRLILEGVAYSQTAAQHAEQIARLYSRAVLNLIDVRETQRLPGDRPLVYLDLYFMEIKSEALRHFGIEWYPGAQDRQGGEGWLSSMVGVLFNLLPKIRTIRERGDGKILEHPRLVVKSGDRGEFFSGMEIPYTTEQQIAFKNAGISIDVEPIAYGASVDLKIAVELSVPAAGVNGAIDRRRIATTAYCRSGQSLVLGGLWGAAESTGRNLLPGAVDPSTALFTLAHSRKRQHRETDFVIFVTPRVASVPDSAEAVTTAWQEAVEPPAPPVSKRPSSGHRHGQWHRGARDVRAAVPLTAKPGALPVQSPETRPLIDVPESLQQ
ncbi:MAG: pilus assembly protein N-terminal domain-containing protein [Deltaproteobacteria bacterium]|nr:pilus assembly protein N-terminal domain-containing protein [Deltaproteobacteria bacterium]